MKRNLLAVVLLLLCVLSLYACGGEEPKEELDTCTVTYIWQSPASTDGPQTYTTEVLCGERIIGVHAGEDAQYMIEGWYRDGVRWNFSDRVLEDMTLEANWARRSYTVSYVVLGNVRADSERCYGDKAIDAYAENPEYMSSLPEWKEKIESGYRFAGWLLNDKPWDFENDVVTGDIVLEALFLTAEEQ